MPVIYIKSEENLTNTTNELYNTAQRFYKDRNGISIITCTNRPEYIDNLFNNFLCQNHDKKELIIVLNNNCLDIKIYQKKAKQHKNIKIFQLDEKITLGDCKNFALNYINFDYVSFFDDDDFYAPNFLKYSLKTFDEIDADIVGKASCYIYFEESKILGIFDPYNENSYVTHVADSSMLIKSKVLENIKYPNEPIFQDFLFQEMCINKGYKLYSTHRFNYVIHRHPNPNLQHDWKIHEEDLIKDCEIVQNNIDDYTKHVVL